MENEQEHSTQTPVEENTLVYIVGAVIVVAVIVAGVIMWPKTKTTSEIKDVQSTPSTKTLTQLTCDSEWYNPVIGMSKYYLSARGSDIKNGTIECTFTLTNASGAAILNEKVTTTTTPTSDKNGETFTCTTKALEKIPQRVPLMMTSLVKNDEGKTASCTGTVTFQ